MYKRLNWFSIVCCKYSLDILNVKYLNIKIFKYVMLNIIMLKWWVF